MLHRSRVLVLLAVLVTSAVPYASANLMRNPSFEDVTGSTHAQGLMPNDWVQASTANGDMNADTYSTDGSYGLSPSDYGDFVGVTAYDGTRWVAGWSAADEVFGQWLTDPLIAGQQYVFSCAMVQSTRGDLNNPGGYDLYLCSDASLAGRSLGVLLGYVGSTSGSRNWEVFSMSFMAPANASTLGFLEFSPQGTGAGAVYPGLDGVSLDVLTQTQPQHVPDGGATIGLLGLALAALRLFVRRQ